jgi:hypothetical protein
MNYRIMSSSKIMDIENSWWVLRWGPTWVWMWYCSQSHVNYSELGAWSLLWSLELSNNDQQRCCSWILTTTRWFGVYNMRFNILTNLVFVDHHPHHVTQWSFPDPLSILVQHQWNQIICTNHFFVNSTNHFMARFNLKQTTQCWPYLELYLWIASMLLLGAIRKSQASSITPERY